jgi:phage baseplate assembly protein W
MSDITENNNDFLGRGIAFPLQLQNGVLAMNAYDAQVKQSIHLILSTAKGERVMRPDFGAGLERFAFEPDNGLTAMLVQQEVKEVLMQYEPRIDVLDVSVVEPGGKDSGNGIRTGELYISIDYKVKTTNTTGNLVYPFYIERGESA